MYVSVSLGILPSYSLLYEGAKRTPVTCVYCRSPWAGLETVAASAGSGSTTREGYLNMSGAAGISGIRDTSSCESFNAVFIIWYSYVLDYGGPARYGKYRSYGRRNYH